MVINKPKSIVIIDGSNFYHKLKELKIPHRFSFDYSKFVKYLAGDTKIQMKYYCVGKIRAEQKALKARQMMAKQHSLVTRLQKEKFVIQFGYLLKYEKHYHEKGVDIQIATNILKGAFRNLYDKVYLVSSDSDLIPAIKEAKSVGKEIIYVGFEHKPSFALLKTCTESHLLTRNELIKFIKK